MHGTSNHRTRSKPDHHLTRSGWSIALVAVLMICSLLLASCDKDGTDEKTIVPDPATAISAEPQAIVSTTNQPPKQAVQPTALGTTIVELDVATRPTPSVTPAPSPTPITPEPVQLNDLAWSPDGRSLAASSATGVYFFDAQNWEEARFLPMVGDVESMAFNYDGTQLGTAVNDSGNTRPYSLLIWNTVDGSLLHTLDKFGHGLQASRNSPLWAALDSYGNAALWQSGDNRSTRTIAKPSEDVSRAVAVSADGTLVAVGSDNGTVGISRTDSGHTVARIVDPEEGDPVTTQWSDLAFDPTGRIFAGGGWGNLITFWNADNGQLLRRVFGGKSGDFDHMMMAMDFAPDGSVLATTHDEGLVRLWNADGTARTSWNVEGGWLRDVVFSPDGQRLAVLAGQMIRIFSTDGTLLQSLEPVFHPRATPVPTPTPIDLIPSVSIPDDWPSYKEVGGRYILRHPPTWRVGLDEEYGLMFGADGTPVMVFISLHSVSNYGEPVPLEEITSLEKLIGDRFDTQQEYAATMIANGEWPFLVPGPYIEYETTNTKTTYRHVVLRSPLNTQNYVEASLMWDLSDILPETLRQDLSRVIASMELTGQPYVSPTPTATPTPKVMSKPPPVGPLIITLRTDPERPGTDAYFTVWVEIRDAAGNPVSEADVFPVYFGYVESTALKNEGNGLYRTRIATSDPQIIIRVKWGTLSLQEQEFMFSFQ